MGAQTGRLPASAMTSLMLHAGLLGLYLHLSRVDERENLKVVANVDLMIQVHRALAVPRPLVKAPTPPSTWNFLKMALPSIPKVAAPQTMQLKAPEIAKPILQEPSKLQEAQHRSLGPKLAPLDLNARRPQMARVQEKLEDRHAAALAALPRLEEVGTRRVRNLPQALKLEERRQEAAALSAIQTNDEPTHRHISPMAEALQEAPQENNSGLLKKIASLLPTQDESLEPRAEMRPAPDAIAKKLSSFTPPPLEKRKTQALQEKKKGVEIEGPLADRRVVAYEVPPFPSWARDQGMLEAAVAIRFRVSPAGDVLPDMRVERTSGYGRLDRVAMDALRNWRFAPLSTAERQWGVITFRFVLE